MYVSTESQANNELGIISNEQLENLRIKIWDLEEQLTRYGFEPGRGIETYSGGELRKILNSLPIPKRKKALEIISMIIELQETLYWTLYKLAGATEVVKNVDTDTPEIRLQKLREWLDNYASSSKSSKKRKPNKSSKSFSIWVKKTLYLCLKAKNTQGVIDEIEELLTKAYKRKYDRFRVLSAIVEACEELDQDVPRLNVDMTLREAIEQCIIAVSKVPENMLLKNIKRRYRS